MVDAFQERRQFVRYALQSRWNIYHLQTGRTFHCRCLDISAGGAKFSASLYMPVRQGHDLKLLPGELLDAEQHGFIGNDEIDAEIVWVNRESILSTGQIHFAARFDLPQQQ